MLDVVETILKQDSIVGVFLGCVSGQGTSMEETPNSSAFWHLRLEGGLSVGLLGGCLGGFQGLLSGHRLYNVIRSRPGGFLDSLWFTVFLLEALCSG